MKGAWLLLAALYHKEDFGCLVSAKAALLKSTLENEGVEGRNFSPF